MPELAEVEYYRKQWDAGFGKKVTKILLHGEKRIFRGTDIKGMERLLPGAMLLESKASGKQMVFRFSKNLWLGLHLGMTGMLRVEAPGFVPQKHDHLVLCQKERTLVFKDMRQFGRVRFHQGKDAPEWWSQIPAALTSNEFTQGQMTDFLQRHGKLPVKAALLLQSGFPGVGNWMADEILWRAKIAPQLRSSKISGQRAQALWKSIRFVCRQAIRHVGPKFDDPPKDWLFHQRWSKAGRCPNHRVPLSRATVGGRTTAWCQLCQQE
ncbi:MAG TPA: DNA-formamidopyrimidine glycosylase family protein [Verrucomicrobiae bacterium]